MSSATCCHFEGKGSVSRRKVKQLGRYILSVVSLGEGSPGLSGYSKFSFSAETHADLATGG